MLNGTEIRAHAFRKGVRGYLIEDVEEFVNQVAHDYDILSNENQLLKGKIESLQLTLEHYKALEETLQENAENARRSAELLKENAERQAELAVERSKIRLRDLLGVYQDVIHRINMINLEIKAQLTAQLELMNKTGQCMENLTDYFYDDDFKNLMEDLDALGKQVSAEDHNRKRSSEDE